MILQVCPRPTWCTTVTISQLLYSIPWPMKALVPKSIFTILSNFLGKVLDLRYVTVYIHQLLVFCCTERPGLQKQISHRIDHRQTTDDVLLSVHPWNWLMHPTYTPIWVHRTYNFKLIYSDLSCAFSCLDCSQSKDQAGSTTSNKITQF